MWADVLVFARLLGLHADSDWTCQRYTFMLVDEYYLQRNFVLKIGWTTSWRCPVWFLLCLPFSYYYPLFPPKKEIRCGERRDMRSC